MNKNNIGIMVVIVLVLLLSLMLFFYFKTDSNYSSTSSNTSSTEKTDTVNINTSSQVTTALEEQIRLHATYKFKKLLVNTNQLVKEGTKIIEYTNGKYLTAPYDLIITGYDLPESNGTCSTSHYIKVSSFNVLSVSFRVSEEKIASVYLGQKAKIKIPSLNDRELKGYVTDISSTANNGRFTVIVEFDNDGDVRIGMSVNVSI